jgi:rhodanese-related sulfurtransferase
MKTISPQALSQSPTPLTLIDVRTPGEFQEMHIPQAILVPLEDISSTLLEGKLGGKLPIVLSCLSGKRAEKAAVQLQKEGWDVTLLEGSLQGWEKAGLPVIRGTPSVLPLMRQVQIVIGTVNLASALLALFVNSSWIWVNVAIGGGLLFAGLSGFCGLALLLGKMPWNRLPSTGCCQS